MTQALGPTDLIGQFRNHSRLAQVGTVVLALLIGAYAAWLGGDYGLGLGSLVGFTLVAGFVLVQQSSGRAVIARGLYLFAVLVLATPLFLNLPLVTASHPGLAPAGRALFHPGVAVLSGVFVVLAGVLIGIGSLVGE